jgi:hypothetical protein
MRSYELVSVQLASRWKVNDEGKFRELVQLKEFIEDLETMINQLDIACPDWR